MRTLLPFLLVLLVAACGSMTGLGLVGSVSSDGSGFVTVDERAAVVALGQVSGVVTVFSKSLGVPLAQLFAVDEGQVFLRDPDGDTWTQDLEDPLPAWAAELFLPGQAQAFGVTFEDPGA